MLAHITRRLQNGVGLEEAVREDYVRRNLSQAGVDEVVSDPDLLRAVRERMESTFESGSLDPHVPSERGRTSPE